MERRVRVVVACVLFAVALLLGQGRAVLGAIGAAPQGDVMPVTAMATR